MKALLGGFAETVAMTMMMQSVALLMLGQGFLMSQTLGLRGVMAAFMAHFIYGGVLGAIAGNGAT